MSAAPEASEPKESSGNKLWGWFTDKLADKVVMLVVGLVIGSWWNSSAPYLQYSTGDAIKFAGTKDAFSFFVVTIANTGSKKADEVRCDIILEGAQIDDVQSGPDNLEPKVTIIGDRAVITLDHLNAGEQAEIAIKTNSSIALKQRKISVRGDGIVGVQTGTTGNSNQSNLSQITMICLALFIPAAIGWFLTSAFFGLSTAWERYRDDKRPKRFVVRVLGKENQIYTSDEADKMYSQMTMKKRRLEINGKYYSVDSRNIDDDGTLEMQLTETSRVF